jgi:transposase-like protein
MNFSGNGGTGLFDRCHFDSTVVSLGVRWYLAYNLSYRGLQAMIVERGIELAHTTIMRWVQRYVPAFEKCWRRYARPVGASWRVDERSRLPIGRTFY